MTHVVDVCNELQLLDDRDWINLERFSVFFKGERYDAPSKTVSDSGPTAARWLNNACAGTALAKMVRLGYNPELRGTTPAQRQATIKMITADYCGTGRSFTQTGEPLLLGNAAGNLTPGSLTPGQSHEAIFDEHGAVCLDVPRLTEDWPVVNGVRELFLDIQDECGGQLPPSCDSLFTLDSQGLYQDWQRVAEWTVHNGDN